MTHPTDDSLKPCPFCGGAAALHPRTCDKDTPYNPADRAFPVARCGQCGAEAVGKDWGRPETAAEKWNARALLAEQARTEPWEPRFDVMSPTQERLVQEFCHEIAGPRGKPGRPPDAVRLLEMAQELYDAERKECGPAAPLLTHKAEDAPSDGELLDWLEAHLFERKWSGTIGQPSGWYMAGPYRHTMQHMRGESLRAAIRAAIAQERKS